MTFLEEKRGVIRLVVLQEQNEPMVTTLEHTCQTIQCVNKNNFAIHEMDNVRLLTIDVHRTSFFKEKLIFRDSSYTLIKILADKNLLYILSKSGPQYVLKCFNLETDLEIEQTGFIDGIEEFNPAFIENFIKSNIIFANILIVDQE